MLRKKQRLKQQRLKNPPGGLSREDLELAISSLKIAEKMKEKVN